jgi:phage-related protein
VIPLLYETTQPIPAPERMNYLGRLNKCQSCKVSEQLNGEYSLTATFLPTDELIGEIQNQRFICASSNPFDSPQFFEICSVDYSENGVVDVKGRHIKHCANNNLILDLFSDVALEVTPETHWNYVKDLLTFENFFAFSSDITAKAAIQIGWTRAGTLGEFFEELAQTFGGEFHYDNFNVNFPLNRGTKKNFVLRWNKNIAAPKLSLSTANIYSHVVATANVTINRGTTSFDAVVYSAPSTIKNNTSKIYRIYQIDATNQIPKSEIDWDSDEDRYALATALQRASLRFARLDYKNQIQYQENVNLQLNYRPAVDEMKEIGLGDTINVVLKGGRTVEAKITKTVYDSLAERWESVTLGEEKLSLATIIAKK